MKINLLKSTVILFGLLFSMLLVSFVSASQQIIFSNSQIYSDLNSQVPSISCSSVSGASASSTCDGGYYPDQLTANKLCQKKGYDGAISFTIQNNFFTSCNDNYLWKYNGNSAENIWACTINSGINTVTCYRDTVICSSNSQCNDNNARTEDICSNAGTSSSSCSHNNIRCLANSDCGADGFTGNNFCQGNGIFQNYNSFICSNPGTSSSSCSNSVSARLKSSCFSGQICSNAQCITTQCSNSIDDDLDGLTDSQDPGCWNNVDNANTYNPLLNNEGRAGISCFTSAQCGRDGFIGNKYCKDGSVSQDYKSFTCSSAGLGSASCSSSTIQKSVQVCANGCANAACLNFICSTNADCNDNDVYTIDACNNAGTSQSSCSHTKVNCVNDNDCGINGFFGVEFCSSSDVFKNFKTSRCVNPGTLQSKCQVSTAATLILDCGDSRCDDYGTNYCKNGNIYHQRTCNDKGCNNGACSSTFRAEENLVQNCANGCANGQCKPECTTNADCSNGKICQNNVCVVTNCNSDSDCNDNNPDTQDICLNPGTTSSSCQHNAVRCNADSDCGVSSFLNQLTCLNGNVFDSYLTFMCSNPGTGTSSCMNHTESRQVNNCTNGCLNGQCIADMCSVDLDCHADYTSPTKTCSGKDVFELFHDYSCSNSKCVDNSSLRFVETCDYQCRDGSCKSKTSGTLLEEDTTETSPLVLINNRSDEIIRVYGSVSEDINETALKLGRNYAIESDNSNYLLWFLIGLIILIIIILIILLVLFFRR